MTTPLALPVTTVAGSSAVFVVLGLVDVLRPVPLAPVQGASVPASALVVQVRVDVGVSLLQFEVCDNPGFGTHVQTSEFDPGDALSQAGVLTVALPVTLIAGALYYWHVQEVLPSGTSAWSVTASFQVGASVGVSAAYALWDVPTSFSVVPVLWYVAPAAVADTDTFTCVGSRFGATAGSLTYGSLQPTVSSWTFVPASANAYTIDRVIDAVNNICDPDHWEVQASLDPDLTPDGYADVTVSVVV